MRLLVLLAAAALAGCCATSLAPAAQAEFDGVERIDIDYDWQGMGRRQERYRILRQDDGFLLLADYEHSPPQSSSPPAHRRAALSQARVQRLWQALQAPAVDAATGRERLARQLPPRRIVHAFDRQALRYPTCARDMRAEYRDQIQQPSRRRAWVERYFRQWSRTDDYPDVRVTVHGRAGAVTFQSNQQGATLLPWRDSAGRENWNPDVPEQLARLLPADSEAHARLSQRALAIALGADQAYRLGQRCEAEDAAAGRTVRR